MFTDEENRQPENSAEELAQRHSLAELRHHYTKAVVERMVPRVYSWPSWEMDLYSRAIELKEEAQKKEARRPPR